MTPHETHTARLLIVDDQEANVLLLERLLRRSGYTAIASTTDARRVCALVADQQPDLVLLDLHMPHLDGFAVLAQLGGVIPPDAYLPILVLTADITPAAKQRALALGAKDFLTKPFDATEVLLRIGNLLQTRALRRHLQRENDLLEARVRARTRELEEAELETLERLARTAEYRDALMHVRPYKRAWGVDEALAEQARQGGRQFDPHIVRSFLQMQDSADQVGAA